MADPVPAAPAAPVDAPAVPAVPAAPPADAPAPDAPIGNLVADAKPDEAKPDAKVDAKPDDKKPEDKPAEAKLDGLEALKLPEGIKADDPMFVSFKADAAEAGLNGEQAQKLLDKYAGKLVPIDAVKAQLDAPLKLWKDTQQQWQKDVKADPEIGGQNFSTNIASIAKVIDQFGGKESAKIREAFNYTGAGNNPEIVRFLHRVSKALNTEGKTVTGGKPANVTFQTAANKLYPSNSPDA